MAVECLCIHKLCFCFESLMLLHFVRKLCSCICTPITFAVIAISKASIFAVSLCSKGCSLRRSSLLVLCGYGNLLQLNQQYHSSQRDLSEIQKDNKFSAVIQASQIIEGPDIQGKRVLAW